MHALIPELNRVVLALAPQHVARSHAPASFDELMRAGAPLPVWEGASGDTIWGDARVNHAFRAWHDDAHRRGLCDFSIDGEARACEIQCRDILAAYPRAPQLWLDTMRAEVNGQVQFFVTNGAFPIDQTGLVRAILRGQGYNVGG